MHWTSIFLMLGGLFIVAISFLATPTSQEADKSIFFLSLTGALWFICGVLFTIAWDRKEKWLAWLILLILVASMVSKATFMWYGLSAYFRMIGY